MLTLDNYIAGLTKALNGIDRKAFDALVAEVTRAHKEDKFIYTCGNGGSASTASHMINDIVKAPNDASGCRPIRAIGLTDCTPLMTALANDISYDQMFARQLNAWGREGDLLIAISGSGNSPNILEAIKLAKQRGMRTVGMTGYSGGKMAEMVDVHLHVPCNCMAQVEDAHLILQHCLVEVLKIVNGGKSPATI
ncbi:MAG: hypothetical protein AMXMBFR84_30640 [Candidatus Hydrogenedentota bacterium]